MSTYSDRWRQVYQIREQLEDIKAKKDLATGWRLLDANYLVLARDDARMLSEEPVASLFEYVRRGMYPPPELLIFAADQFERYMDSQGDLTLEETFFGPPTKGKGAFAQRSQLPGNYDLRTFQRYLARFETAIEAAEAMVKDHDLNVEPESIVRGWSRFQRREAQVSARKDQSDE